MAPMAVRFYYPTDEALAGKEAQSPTTPVIVYVHGGGFVLGNLDTHDRICRILARNTGAIVVAVDYRLSPEAKFPSAVEEVAFVAQFLHEEEQPMASIPSAWDSRVIQVEHI